MTEEHAAHSHPWKISDVVIFPLLALGLLLEWIMPTTLGLPRTAGLIAGLLIAAGGFWLIQNSKRALDRAGQPSLPEAPTTALVTTGPFRWTRNPNYLGAGIALFGGAVAIDSIWLIGTAALTIAVLDVWMIRPEEAYLSRIFGADYADYSRRVRRWI